MTYREIITIFVGQAGAQVSNACWELFCYEHGIEKDGSLKSMYKPKDILYFSFFASMKNQKFIPRTIIVDLKPRAINKIRIGHYKDLFHPDSLIAGKETSTYNFINGYKLAKSNIMNVTLDRIRIMCESCSNLDAFIIFRACGGGTGSGFTTLLLERLKENYPNILKFGFVIQNTSNIASTVEPYNTILAAHYTIDCEDCCFMVDNEALYNICDRNLIEYNEMYVNINRLIAQLFSGITTTTRFPTDSDISLREIRNLLTPYSRTHFPLTTYVPIASAALKTTYPKPADLWCSLTSQTFQFDYQMLNCNPCSGRYTSCCLLYRGDTIEPYKIHNMIEFLKKNDQISFKPDATIKVVFNTQPATTLPGGNLANTKLAITNLGATTALRYVWQNIICRFQTLYKCKIFFHHFSEEDMDIDQTFQSAKTNIINLINEYEEMEK